MSKLQRNYKLTIKEDGQDEVIIEYPLTLDFAIRRATWSMSGSAKIRIFNLGKDTRRKIYKNPIEISRFIKIKLEAGYGDNISTIFDGDILWSRSMRAEGQTDFITEIECFNYGYVKNQSESNWSVEGNNATTPPYGTSKDQVIRRLVSDLKYLENGEKVSMPIGAIGEFDKTKRRAFIASGNTWETLKTETGNKCFIDDGKVYCLGINEVVEGDIREISSETGLLGTPEVDGMFLTFNMIFEPSLKIGQKISLNSRAFSDFNGIYKVVSVDHTGTISGAVSGKLITTATFVIGSEGIDDPFTILKQGE